MSIVRNHRRVTTCATLATVLLLAAGGWTWAQTSRSPTAPGGTADDAAIRAAVAAFTNGWNSHDAHLMTSYLADDVEWTAWTGNVTHGRTAVEAGHHEEFEGIYKNTHRTDTIKSIYYLGPDLVSVDFGYVMTGAKKRDGSDWPYRAGYVNFVMAKRDGRWTVVISHTADANATAPASTRAAN